MSTLSIVALTVFASLFGILSIAAAAAIIYGQLQLRKHITTSMTLVAEHRSQLQLTVKDIGVTLESHRSKMDAFIQKINGEEISQAAKVIAASAQRIERATIAFSDLARALLSEEALAEVGGDVNPAIARSAIARAAASGLGPDSYAPNATGERYTSVNRTAQGDAEALADEERDYIGTSEG